MLSVPLQDKFERSFNDLIVSNRSDEIDIDFWILAPLALPPPPPPAPPVRAAGARELWRQHRRPPEPTCDLFALASESQQKFARSLSSFQRSP